VQIIKGLAGTLKLLFKCQIKFNQAAKNRKIVIGGEEDTYRIFRRVEIVRNLDHEPEAYFVVRFRPKRMSAKANEVFSYIPMMIFMGFSGFCSKYWAVNDQTNACMGVYEWETIADAKWYASSVAMAFMTKRSVKGSVSFKIYEKAKEQLKIEIYG